MKAGRHPWRALVADSSLALVLKGLSLPLGYLVTLAIARQYGALGLGTYTLAVYLITSLSVVCRLGLDTGMLRYGATLQAAGETGQVAALFRGGLVLILGCSSAAALGVYLLGGWLGRVFQAPGLPDLLPGVALTLPVAAAVMFCGETLRSLGGARWVVFQHDVLGPMALLLLVMGLGALSGRFDGGLSALGWALLATSALGALVVGLKLQGLLAGPRPQALNAPFRDLWRASWPLYLSALLMLAFGALDTLILGLFTGPAPVAYYESASRTALLVGLPLLAVNAAVPPLFARLHHRGSREELEGLGRTTSRWMYYGSLPVALFTVALAPEILGLFGPDFPEARVALRLLALAQLANVACGSVGFLLAMTGNQLTLTRILAVGGAAGLPLLALGAATSGMNGLAAAKTLWLFGVNVLMTLGVWRRLGIKIWAMGVGWITLSGLGGLLLFWLVRPLAGPWVAAVLGLLLYVALVSKNLYQEFAGFFVPARWEASP